MASGGAAVMDRTSVYGFGADLSAETACAVRFP